jgi:hypothetical protein
VTWQAKSGPHRANSRRIRVFIAKSPSYAGFNLHSFCIAINEELAEYRARRLLS